MAADQLAFTQVNCGRIQAVESLFGPSGKPLAMPGRVLVGEGRLMKHSRRRCQPKVFFLFSDVLVYGSVVVSGRWCKKQRIISLEDIVLEDTTPMDNQWLIRTPRKSFYVAADSPEEKRAWMEHIVECRDRKLRTAARQRCPTLLPSAFAPTWIPDQASAVCMRCFDKFTFTQRRHHCRNCGFLVCAACSKPRAVVRHIHCSHTQRVCHLCYDSLRPKKQDRGYSVGDMLEVGGGGGDDYDDEGVAVEQEEAEWMMESHGPTRWLD